MRTHAVAHLKNTTTIDRLMMVVAVIHPLMTLPQVYELYSSQSAVGLSLWTWLGYAALGVVFLAYALAHRLKPVILTQVLWFIMDALIVAGIIIYS